MSAEPLLPDLDRPDAFAAPWEAQIFAMVVKLHERGLFEWSEFAGLLSTEIHAHPDEAYYHCWFHAAVDLLVAKGVVDEAAFEEQAMEVQRFRNADHHHVARATPITVVPAGA